MIFLEVKGLSKCFGLTRALNGVSFEVLHGETLVIHGPNGAGKSTLLSCMAGVYRPDEGKVVFHDEGAQTVHRNGFASRHNFSRKFGFVAQQSYLYGDLTVEENLELHGLLCGVANYLQMRDEVSQHLGFTSCLKKKIRECSEGMKRRVSIARAILHQPSLLILDEPFSNLDRTGQEQLSQLLHRHCKCGGTTVLTTHDSQVIQEHATRVLSLRAGRICDYGH